MTLSEATKRARIDFVLMLCDSNISVNTSHHIKDYNMVHYRSTLNLADDRTISDYFKYVHKAQVEKD